MRWLNTAICRSSHVGFRERSPSRRVYPHHLEKSRRHSGRTQPGSWFDAEVHSTDLIHAEVLNRAIGGELGE